MPFFFLFEAFIYDVKMRNNWFHIDKLSGHKISPKQSVPHWYSLAINQALNICVGQGLGISPALV